MTQANEKKMLPARVVDVIFDELTLTFGREFRARWEGTPISAVKNHWAEKLGAYQDRPWAIAHALRHLPREWAPNVLQFADLCKSAPNPELLKVAAPRSKPSEEQKEIVRSILDRLTKAKKTG